MKKIPTLFQRNHEGDHLVRNEVTPGCEWVLAGEGEATIKIDGTACMVKDGKLYKRYDAKRGKKPPAGFVAADEPDEITGHWPGWLAVGEGPEDKWHREAFDRWPTWKDATYELVGPKVQGNPYCLYVHTLVRHGFEVLDDAPRNFEGIKSFLETFEGEGIVWHHPDGRMCKIKRKDYNLPWPLMLKVLS